MTVLRLRAHADGKVFQPDEPVNLPPDTSLLLTVQMTTQAENRADDDQHWNELALAAFEAVAYGPDEPAYATVDLLPG